MKNFMVLTLIFALLTTLLTPTQESFSSLDHSAPIEHSENSETVGEDEIPLPLLAHHILLSHALTPLSYPPHITLLSQELYPDLTKPPSLT